jgi:hypothetical protein
MKLLKTFDGLLGKWRTVFSQERTFVRARRLTFGLLTRLRVHLTSTAICASGRQFQDWSAALLVHSGEVVISQFPLFSDRSLSTVKLH